MWTALALLALLATAISLIGLVVVVVTRRPKKPWALSLIGCMVVSVIGIFGAGSSVTPEEKAALQQKRAEKDAASKAEVEQKAKAGAEKKAKAEAEQKAKAEAEQKAKAEAEQKAKAEAEQKAKAEAEQKAKAEVNKEAQGPKSPIDNPPIGSNPATSKPGGTIASQPVEQNPPTQSSMTKLIEELRKAFDVEHVQLQYLGKDSRTGTWLFQEVMKDGPSLPVYIMYSPKSRLAVEFTQDERPRLPKSVEVKLSVGNLGTKAIAFDTASWKINGQTAFSQTGLQVKTTFLDASAVTDYFRVAAMVGGEGQSLARIRFEPQGAEPLDVTLPRN